MKQSRPRLLFFLTFLLAAVSFVAAQQVTILHVNDTHSHIDAWGPKDANLNGILGGLPKVATVIGMQKFSDPEALFVHAGDLIHGDPFFNQYLGVPELLMLESLGLDAMAVGNHEFQYGPDFLAAVLYQAWPTSAGPPLVSSNLDLVSYPLLEAWIQPTTVIDSNGVKVGFFGITTPYDLIERPAPVVIDSGAQLFADAAVAVTKLRAEGAKVVVCLCHTGMELSRQIAQTVPGIDVIVNGHDHVTLQQPEMVGSTIIVSAGEYYRWVGRLRLNVNGSQVSFGDYALISVDQNIPSDPSMQAAVDSLKPEIVASYGDIYQTQIAWSSTWITKEFDPDHIKRDTPLGDLIADAYRNWTGTDIALEASGFINESLPPGPIVGADVFRSMSYAMPDVSASGLSMNLFRLATFRIKGSELVKGLEFSLTNPDLYPQISGMRFQIDSRKPVGQRVLLDTVHVNGHKLVLNRLYSVTATEGFVMFLPLIGLQFQDVVTLPDTAYESIRKLVIARSVLYPDSSGRIRDVGAIPGKNKH